MACLASICHLRPSRMTNGRNGQSPNHMGTVIRTRLLRNQQVPYHVSKSPIPYQSGHDKAKDIFKGAFLWNMPEDDIEQYVKPVWETMHTLLVAHTPLNYGIRGKNLIPGSSFNSVFHLRPHASKGKDNGSAKDRSSCRMGKLLPSNASGSIAAI